MYSVKKINGFHYVVNNKTGTTMPYHLKKKDNQFYLTCPLMAYKIDDFKEWIGYSNSTRMRINKMSGLNASPARTAYLNEQLNWYAKMMNLDCCNEASPANPSGGCYREKENEGNKKMFDDIDNPERAYLSQRLDNVRWKHDAKLEKQYKLHQDNPATAEEAVERIKAGNYQLKDKKDRAYLSPLGAIVWRAPGEEPDLDGYLAATEKLKTAKQNANDVIMTMDAEKGLAALKEFEAATFH